MKKVWIGLIVIALLIAAGFIFAGSKSNTQPVVPTNPFSAQPSPSATITEGQKTITLTSPGFEPATLTIKAGDEVTWINKSGLDAAVNSSPHPTHTDYPPLNLGNFSDGRMLSLVFEKSGTFKYHNHLNPSQFGTIIVE